MDLAEQAVLARWSGWGAIPEVFDDRTTRFATERVEIQQLLGDEKAWSQARRTTINAHYTSASVVTAMWDAASRLGVDESAHVLEPGCGSGNFIGLAPKVASLTGVEMDPTTAEIARLLYGSRATIESGAFEDHAAANGTYDLVIGNVPFGKVIPHDPTHNRNRHALHNYFLIKSLNLVRPGGLLVALTSRYTLDAQSGGARSEMAELADLVGAVRLPARAFAASSGTDVVTDLLLLRRRARGDDLAGASWESSVVSSVTPDESAEPLAINEYYEAHPENILGELETTRGMYRERELTVTASGDLDSQLREALGRIVAQSQQNGFVLTPAPSRALAEPDLSSNQRRELAYGTTYAQDGSFVVDEQGAVARVRRGIPQPFAPRVAKDRSELSRLVLIRDAAREVLATQVAGGDDASIREAQAGLHDRYSTYVRLYGPINRSSQARTGRTDASGADIMRRVRPRMGGFRDDPDWPLVAALEVFDDETQRASPAAIFSERVVDPPRSRSTVDTPEEAVAVCLDESGTVELDRAAELLQLDANAARSQLGTLVYDDPESEKLVPAAQYLSGNVRTKISIAEGVAATDKRFESNLAALKRVLPRQLEPHEISARLGAPWIPPTDIEAFCSDVLDVRMDVERLADLGSWSTKLQDGSRRSIALSSEWGTARADAAKLLDAALNQRLHTVWDSTDDGRRVRNDAETLAARDKQEALSVRFSEWAWEEPLRAERLAERYNTLFSSTVLPVHDGSHLSFPKLAASFVPRQHQRDAVARVLTDGRALLAHAVGAGKTATMVMAAMEQRRLGSVSKPAVVVPNHMLEQFSREWLQLYPTARILVADKERLSKDRRKEFVARAATGDWDGIVFTQSGFARLPLGKGLMTSYLGEEIETARRALAGSKDGKGLSVKRLESRIAQMESTYKRLLSEHTKDDGVRFEETGIDYLYVDEAHAYKNRRVDSSIDGVAAVGSQRAQDLDAKLWALRRSHGERVVTFATATPVANSMAELWVMQSYLHPDLLKSVELRAFDSWAATFGRTHTALELAPDGSSYRMQTRFARFQNVPELLSLYRQVADVRSTEDLKLPTPALVGGSTETVMVEPCDRLVGFVAELADRAERVRNRRVDPSEDNMLKITGEGRRAALDLRLVGEHAGQDSGKVRVAAQRIANIHHATRELAYGDDQGQLTLRQGALQLVFCDVSTPAGDGWNAYDELRDQLVSRGVEQGQIRYMQSATTDVAKATLFAACRDGTVAVLIGSTETMGVGTNVQARAVALHHLDAPWRPADIEQRDGRILRQGNQNPEVSVIRYVTEGSFDTYMWQTLERKAAFISQVTRGDLPDRDVEDIGDQALTFAEVKALATGDPLVLEKAGVDAEVARLSRLERSHQDDQHRLRRTLDSAELRAEQCDARVHTLEQAIAHVVDTRGDRFAMSVAGEHFSKRGAAGSAVRQVGERALNAVPHNTAGEELVFGRLGGQGISLQAMTTIADEIRLRIPSIGTELTLTKHDWQTLEPSALIGRLERPIQRLPDTLEKTRAEGDAARVEAQRASARVGQPWEQTAELSRLRRRQLELNEELTESASNIDHTSGLDLDNGAASHNACEATEAPDDSAERMKARLDNLESRSSGRSLGGPNISS